MCYKKYYAHSGNKDDKSDWQELKVHLKETAELSRAFAHKFKQDELGRIAGKLHDLGKYSNRFQKRLEGGVKVDHATAGAKEVDADKDDAKTMGRKHIVPYGLYRAEGYISAKLAQDVYDKDGKIKKYGTGFSETDLNLLFEAIENMFEHDRSAARGKMAVRGFYIFKHDGELGNAPAHKLFDLLEVKRKGDKTQPPRSFYEDYDVNEDEARANTPQGVEFIVQVSAKKLACV